MSKRKIKHEEIIKRMQELEPEYDFSKFIYNGTKCKSIVICNKGHEYNASWDKFSHGNRCPHCSGNYRFYTTKDIVNRMKELEPTYNFDKFVYVNCRTKSTIICDKGHEYEADWDSFRNGKRCLKCSYRQSKPETEIIEFIKTFYDGTIEQSNRSIIPSKIHKKRFLELDIYIPYLNLAIEFNGRFYHTDEKAKRNGFNTIKEKHDYKYNECFKKGITLIHIDEDDWNNDKESILEQIKWMIEERDYVISQCGIFL